MIPGRTVLPVFLALVVLCGSAGLPAASGKGPVAASGWRTDIAAIRSREGGAVLQGAASVDTSRWGRLYAAGIKASERRCFDEAQFRLQAAVQESARYGTADARWLRSKVALGMAALGAERFAYAERMFNDALAGIRKTFGAESEELAECLHNLGLINILKGKHAEAEKNCRQALEIRQKLHAPGDHRVGATMGVLATALSRQGWHDEAETSFKRAVEIMDKAEKTADFELADTLRSYALWLQSQGRIADAGSLFQRAFGIKEHATHYDQSVGTAGAVSLHWDRGSPEARQLIEGKYPVEYLQANGLRVACTVVDLGYRVAALISIRNETMRKQEIGVGPVCLDVLAPKPQRIVPVKLDPSLRIMEERAFAWLTRGQPFVRNVLITRKTSGYMENGMPDLKRELGANVFGMYGEWGFNPAESWVKRWGYAKAEALAPEADRTESKYIRNLDYVPVALEAGESRTGLVYFANPLFQQAILRMVIGNTTFKFPFHAPPRYSPV